MTIYNTQSKLLISNYAVLQTLEPTEIVVGQSITVAGVAVPFNGTFTVLDTPLYQYIGTDNTTGALLFDGNVPMENQVLYACTGTNVAFATTYAGTVTYTQTCTWVTADELESFLGVDIADPSDDKTLLDQARAAANDFCYRRRQEAGYFDALATVPNASSKLGTLYYGAALWRGRGSVQDTFATFDTMGGGNINAMTPVIKQLLGIDRPAVA